jgi:hypothetical protein
MPWSTELQLRPPRRRQPGNSLPGGGEPDGLIACPELKRRIPLWRDGAAWLAIPNDAKSFSGINGPFKATCQDV